MTDSTLIEKIRLDISSSIKASVAVNFLISALSTFNFSAVTASASNIVVVTEPASKLAVLSLSTMADLMTALSIRVSPVMWVNFPTKRLCPLAPRLIPEMISPAELMFSTTHEPASRVIFVCVASSFLFASATASSGCGCHVLGL
ncbi:Uncharacterised protein [Streptococcus pneumoniae]|nr:Uncharacterised protein [Streptococcus pneumoniae]